MTNADKFKSIFGLYATELWAKPEKDFIEWLNADAELFGNSEQLDNISRAEAINAICEDGTQLERQGQYTMTMAERKQRDADILDALPSAKPVEDARALCGECDAWNQYKNYPQMWWILCSERLPEVGQLVLCTVPTSRYWGSVKVCKYCPADKYKSVPYFDWNENGFPTVVAWMPLPAPYRPKGEGRERID